MVQFSVRDNCRIISRSFIIRDSPEKSVVLFDWNENKKSWT